MKITRVHSTEVQETLLPPGCIQAVWSPNNTQGPVLNTEHVGMHWTASHFEDFWSETQVKLRGATNGVLSTVDLQHYKAEPSNLSYFISCYFVRLFIHIKEKRFLSLVPSFPVFSFCFALCFNSMQLIGRNRSKTCGEQGRTARPWQ